MHRSFLKQVKKHGILSAILFIMSLLVGNFLLYSYNRNALEKSLQAKAQVEAVEKQLGFIWTQVQIADMGLRGFLLIPEESMAVPLQEAVERYSKGFDKLELLLTEQGYDTRKLELFKKMYSAKMEEALLMKRLKLQGQQEQLMDILKKDSGYELWLSFKPLQSNILAFEQSLKSAADLRYENSMANTWILQLLLLSLGMPTLCLVIYRLGRTQREKKALFEQVKQSNDRYLFCDAARQESMEEERVISHLVENLQKASLFIGEITKGNYQVEWQGMGEGNESLNKENLSGRLLTMREQMKKVRIEEQKRLWTTEGFAHFAHLLRLQEEDLDKKVFSFLSELIKYVKANQGALFVVREQSSEECLLELKACYAYGKKKFIKKILYPGEGLVGQAFREKDKIYLTDVPDNYIKISSGLGEDLPRCVLILPLLSHEQVVGVLELASFEIWEPYQVEFMEKVLENLSSALVSAQINSHTKSLLEESLQRAEQMRAQEEEMRQNMEELEATQEDMQRNKQEIELLLEESRSKENQLHQQEQMMRESMEQLSLVQQELYEKDQQQVKEIERLQQSYQLKEQQMQELLLEMKINEEDMQKNEERYRKLIIDFQTLQLELGQKTLLIESLGQENASLKLKLNF